VDSTVCRSSDCRWQARAGLQMYWRRMLSVVTAVPCLRLVIPVLVGGILMGAMSTSGAAAGAPAPTAHAVADTAVARLKPTLTGGQGAPTPRLFPSLSVLQRGRWVTAQTLYVSVIQTVPLRQPILFALAVQTSLPGWTHPRGEVEVFRAVPARTQAPGELQPGKRPVYRASMGIGSRANAYTHFSRRAVFTAPGMTGTFFVFIHASAGGGRDVGHYFFFSIRNSGK
jgi:hypothetical protein